MDDLYINKIQDTSFFKNKEEKEPHDNSCFAVVCRKTMCLGLTTLPDTEGTTT